jgi:hypothetical protein
MSCEEADQIKCPDNGGNLNYLRNSRKEQGRKEGERTITSLAKYYYECDL